MTALQTKTAMTKDKTFNWKFCLCCGLFLWFVINLLQGIFTEIHEDEAYYALYGEHLAWGYFDHPPMVGLMTFLSSRLFSGTLGVRFFTIIASCMSLWVMWELANGRPFDRLRDLKAVEPVETPIYKHVFLFFIIASSIVMFNIYGFITTPDASLILFSALFLLVYQRYLEGKTWPRALLMGVLMACMVYSKYHAFLLLGLIVLSNLKLLKDGRFYLACLIALALLTPHILWQIEADFPSFKYHLSQRSEPFRWSYFWEYLPNQLLIFNPFTFGAVIYVLIKHRPKKGWIASSCLLAMTPKERRDVIASEAKQSRERAPQEVFERGLRFILVGFFFFFWLMAFRGHVEPHWTIVCMIPMVVLLYRNALVDKKLGKYTKHFILPSLLLILAFRIALITPLAARFGFGGKEAYFKAIEQVASDNPVVFRGSFQEPSLYHYFTGKEGSSLRAHYDRKTQFDLWQFDTAWMGKPVFICSPVMNLSKTVEIGNQCIKGYLMPHYQSPNRLVTDFTITNLKTDEMPVLHHGDTLHIAFSIHNPLSKTFDFQHEEMQTRIGLLYQFADRLGYCHYDDSIRIEPHSTYSGELFTVISDKIPAGRDRLMLSLGDGVAPFITEENHIDVIIEE